MNKIYKPYMKFDFNNGTAYRLSRSLPIREIRRLGVKNYFFDDKKIFGSDKMLLKKKKRLFFAFHHWYERLDKRSRK